MTDPKDKKLKRWRLIKDLCDGEECTAQLGVNTDGDLIDYDDHIAALQQLKIQHRAELVRLRRDYERQIRSITNERGTE